MRFGIPLAQLNPKGWLAAARAADELGFESIWMAEHLVLPVKIEGELVPGEEHPPISPSVPVYDAPAYLAHLAAVTERVRLGTFVYLLGIRHPFVTARAFATLDVVSGGRADVGVGAGWMTTEWEAAGLDPKVRGRRLDEAIDVCTRLWRDEVVDHDGACWSFPPVMFEPKPVQQPRPPVHVGGESERALRRAVLRGDGWIGMGHTPESAAARVARLRQLTEELGREGPPVMVTVAGAASSRDDAERWEEAGVDRVIVAPWRRSSEAVDAMSRFADDVWA